MSLFQGKKLPLQNKYVATNVDLNSLKEEIIDEISPRLQELEQDFKAVIDYLELVVVKYKQYQTGVVSNPWLYGKRAIKKETLEKK